MIDYGRKLSDEKGRGGEEKHWLHQKSDSFCELSGDHSYDDTGVSGDQCVTVSCHSPGNIVVTSIDGDTASPHTGHTVTRQPVRKNTLSSGEVTVITVTSDYQPDTVHHHPGDINNDRRLKHITVTSIFRKSSQRCVQSLIQKCNC